MINEIGTQTIETDRLILRRMTEVDAPDMYNYWASDPLVPRFFTWDIHESIDVTKALIKAGFRFVDKSYHSYEKESISGNYLHYAIENLN